jgi:hypothetical protein
MCGAPSGVSSAAPSHSFRRAGIDLEVEEGLDLIAFRFLFQGPLCKVAGSHCNFLYLLGLHIMFQLC